MNLKELPDMSAAYKQVQEKKKDYDGDGKVESGSKEHAGVVHNAIQKKKGLKPDGKDTRKEEVEHVDEAMMAGPRKDAMKKKEYSAKSGSDRATAFNIGTRRDVSVSDPKIKSRGGRTDKRTGEGDRGMGNAAKRRMKEAFAFSDEELEEILNESEIDDLTDEELVAFMEDLLHEIAEDEEDIIQKKAAEQRGAHPKRPERHRPRRE